MITKELLARCQNDGLVAWAKFGQDEDVRKAFKANNDYVELLYHDGGWRDSKEGIYLRGRVYRLSPDTPTEPERDWVERDVSTDCYKFYSIRIDGRRADLGVVLSNADCLGIVYRDLNGVETLRTSVDLAFGVPVRVRFRKEGAIDVH